MIRYLPYLLLLGLLGCATTPPAAFYTLSPGLAAPGTVIPLTLGLTLSEFPEALDRPQLMLRSGENRLDIQELHRWAAPLEGQVRRVLRENLARLTQSPRVETHPWPTDFHPERQIRLAVSRFDGRHGATADLQARWSLHTADGTLILSRTATYSEPAGKSIETLVAAQNRLLERLAVEIGGSMRSEE
ncbi:PqiC family protein [Trichloromonas sp.]|uniref:PqiC family protein n=1 Tax=Trichloromonas sp. TaxID=3069249 RepID=UPI002A3977FA|nr:PqiC family protein [Trichloromonas sp.]